jgi:hypothetical protein
MKIGFTVFEFLYMHRDGREGGRTESDSNRQSAGIRTRLEKSYTVREEMKRREKKE